MHQHTKSVTHAIVVRRGIPYEVERVVCSQCGRVLEEPAADHATDGASPEDDDPHDQAVGAIDSPNATSKRR